MTRDQLKDISEDQLVDLLVTKDRSAMEFLYENYSAALFGVIFRIVRDSTLAEDVLQEVFIKIWNKIYSYDSVKGSLFTWMLNIARHLAIDKTRSKEINKKRKTDSLQNYVYLDNDLKASEQNIDGIGLESVIKELTEDQRILLDLVYYQGYTQSEAAEELKLPLGTVKTRLRNTILQLRKVINL